MMPFRNVEEKRTKQLAIQWVANSDLFISVFKFFNYLVVNLFVNNLKGNNCQISINKSFEVQEQRKMAKKEQYMGQINVNKYIYMKNL